MSYSQFGYTYPSSTQILVSNGGSSQSPCCQPPSADGGGGGSPPQVCTAYATDSRLLSHIPRLASFGLYAAGTSYAEHISSLANNSAFYSTLPNPYDLKESRSSWNATLQPACYPYDPIASCTPYSDRYSSMESVARRKNATRETTNTLKAWLYEHRKNPYPTKGEKIMLAIITKMTLTQVSTWFANARRRLKKENKMTWEPRNKTSEGEDRDSSSPRDIKSDDTTDDCGSLNDFLKQEPGTFAAKESFSSEYEGNSMQQRPLKRCDSFALDCYRAQSHSSEDSIPSESSSPRTACYPGFQQSGKDDPKDLTSSFVADTSPGFDSSHRPKIWSLARTATSNSPPINRRPFLPCHMDFCSEGGQKVDNESPPAKLGVCPEAPFGEFIPDTRTRDLNHDINGVCYSNKSTLGHSVNDLCCSSRSSTSHPVTELSCTNPSYDRLLPNCASPKNKDKGLTSSRGSCMLENSRPTYTTDFPPRTLGENGEHFMYDAKHFKSKVPMGYEGSSLETPSTGLQNCDKIIPYPEGEPHSKSEFFGTEGFDNAQCNKTLQKCCSTSQEIINSPDLSETGLRQNDR